MVSEFQIRPFPEEVIPSGLRNPMQEVRSNIKAPFPLVFASAMGVVSLVCQSRIDVRRPNGLVSPCSLYFISVGDSGERKTTLDNRFKRRVIDFQVEQAVIANQKTVEWDAQRLTWEAQRDTLLSTVKKETKKGNRVDEVRQMLAAHIAAKPVRPRAFKLLYDDATPEAIKHGMFENLPTAGILSDEAGGILNGRAMADLVMFNSLWGGESLRVDRRGSESFTVASPRLTLSLMVQPKPLLKLVNRDDEAARGLGLFSRCLMAYPSSTQGTRLEEDRTPSWEHLPVFHDRLGEILSQISANDFGENRTILELSPDARSRWFAEHNAVEIDLAPGNFLADVKDFASKYCENVVRMAALFHFFEKRTGEISLQTLEQAIEICGWYMHEFKRLFADGGALSPDDADANQLQWWLMNYMGRRNLNYMPKVEVQRFGPHGMRKAKRINPALERLASQGRIRLWPIGGVMFVHLA